MAIMKERLKFHFMNPFEKWRYPERRRFPWKLLVQIASIILVTAQVGKSVVCGTEQEDKEVR